MENKKQNNQTQESLCAVRNVWDNEFFILFMGLRFPKETNNTYITQWRNRIQSLDSFGYMDTQTRQAYQQATSFFIGEKSPLLSNTKRGIRATEENKEERVFNFFLPTSNNQRKERGVLYHNRDKIRINKGLNKAIYKRLFLNTLSYRVMIKIYYLNGLYYKVFVKSADGTRGLK